MGLNYLSDLDLILISGIYQDYFSIWQMQVLKFIWIYTVHIVIPPPPCFLCNNVNLWWKDRWKSAAGLLSSLVKVVCEFPGNTCCIWGLGKRNVLGEGSLEGMICVICQRRGQAERRLEQVCYWAGDKS